VISAESGLLPQDDFRFVLRLRIASFFFAFRRIFISASTRSSTGSCFFALRRIHTSASSRSSTTSCFFLATHHCTRLSPGTASRVRMPASKPWPRCGCGCNSISHVNLRLTKTESFSPKRQTWSVAFEIPIRVPRTMDGVVDRPSNLKGSLSRRFPLSASLTPRACPSRPGPEHSSRRSVLARRRIIRGMPVVGSSDRIRTPAAWPASRHTKFKHQWIP
jgi:hypothetical protein